MFAFVDRFNAATGAVQQLMLQGVRVVAELRDSVSAIEALLRNRLPLTVVQVSGNISGDESRPVALGKAINGPGLLADVRVGQMTMVGAAGLLRRVKADDVKIGQRVIVDVGLFESSMH